MAVVGPSGFGGLPADEGVVGALAGAVADPANQ
jgi:hypothetical protein